MARGLQLLTGRVEKPGSTITAVTMDTGDSNTVRNAEFSNPIRLLSMWANSPAAGLMRIRSSLLHDAVNGIRMRFNATEPSELLPDYTYQLLQPQDLLTIEATGPSGAGEFVTVNALIEYDNLPGANAQLVTYQQIEGNIEHLMGVECNITTSATNGQYGGEQAINTNFDNFRVNRYYAVLGYTTDTAVSAVHMLGVDFGNLRLGGPGNLRKELTVNWFCDLSVRNGQPRIPVFNSANRAGLTVGAVSTAASATPNVTFLLALLKSYTPV
jgi:hypothetical protein